jgi:hypothetical protein
MTYSQRRAAFEALARLPGIYTGVEYAEFINTRVAWTSDGEEATIKALDDHAITVDYDYTGIEIYSRYSGAFQNLDPICGFEL